MPGLFLYTNGYLHACHMYNRNWGQGCIDTAAGAFIAGETYEIDYVVFQHKLSLWINGVRSDTQPEMSATLTMADAPVYASNPWYTAPDAETLSRRRCAAAPAPGLTPLQNTVLPMWPMWCDACL